MSKNTGTCSLCGVSFKIDTERKGDMTHPAIYCSAACNMTGERMKRGLGIYTFDPGEPWNRSDSHFEESHGFLRPASEA